MVNLSSSNAGYQCSYIVGDYFKMNIYIFLPRFVKCGGSWRGSSNKGLVPFNKFTNFLAISNDHKIIEFYVHRCWTSIIMRSWTLKLQRWCGHCSCSNGADTAVAAIVRILQLQQWCGHCSCCNGAETAAAAMVRTLQLLQWCGHCTEAATMVRKLQLQQRCGQWNCCSCADIETAAIVRTLQLQQWCGH